MTYQCHIVKFKFTWWVVNNMTTGTQHWVFQQQRGQTYPKHLDTGKKGRKTWPPVTTMYLHVNFMLFFLTYMYMLVHILFVLFSVHLCIILDTPSARVTCPAGWSMFGTSCYTIFQQQLSWMNASVTTPSAPPPPNFTFENYEIEGSLTETVSKTLYRF